MSLVSLVYVVVVPLGVAATTQDLISKHPCIDPLSSQKLSEAVDVAIVSLHGQNGWLHNLRQSTGYTHPIEVTSCTPHNSYWSWPEAANAEGLLKRVLDTGKLRVAGVKWRQDGAADYKTNPSAPTGFWPEYLHAIAKAMSSHYGKNILVQRVYYANSDLVNQAVRNATDVEMSEPYYYLGGFLDDKPRIEALHVSCVTVATASAFSSTKASGIKNMDGLYEKIVQGPNQKVGFIGAGNYDSVSHVLPANVEPVFITDADTLESQVDDGTLLASYISEASASDSTTRTVYETGVISPRVVLFRKDSTAHCVGNQALQIAAEKAAEGEEDSDTTVPMVATIILAVAVLLLTCLLFLVICRERSGKPLFMPLMEQPSSGGQVIGTTNNNM